jgi:hypothetical protein
MLDCLPTGGERKWTTRMTSTTRSLAPIDRSDLLRLGVLAAETEAGLFARHPQGAGRYAGQLLCRARHCTWTAGTV